MTERTQADRAASRRAVLMCAGPAPTALPPAPIRVADGKIMLT